MAAAIEAIIRRFFDEAWSQGNLAVVDELFAPGYVGHMPRLGLQPGPEGTKQFIALHRRAFPDLRITLDEVTIQGDRCRLRWTAHGTHLGDYDTPITGRLSATGRTIAWRGESVHFVADGKIVEGWLWGDATELLEQLGVLPPN
jgi:predicted ester cyclase